MEITLRNYKKVTERPLCLQTANFKVHRSFSNLPADSLSGTFKKKLPGDFSSDNRNNSGRPWCYDRWTKYFSGTILVL
jgi:hypothetical protein